MFGVGITLISFDIDDIGMQEDGDVGGLRQLPAEFAAKPRRRAELPGMQNHLVRVGR